VHEDEEIVAIFEAEVEELLAALAAATNEEPADWEIETLVHITHTFKGAARMVGARSLARLAHLLEGCFVGIERGEELEPELVELIRAGFELLESIAEDLSADRSEDIAAYRERLAVHVDPTRLARALDEGEAEAGAWSLTSGDAQEQARPSPAPAVEEVSGTTVRVSAEKVEGLMGLASDLLALGRGLRGFQRASGETARAWSELLRRRTELAADPDLHALAVRVVELERGLASTARRHAQIAQEFHDGVRRLRMIRMDALSRIFSRTVRSVARATGKRARFIIEGAATEVDRVTLDALRDPLIHLLRNAVDHGIEVPDQRERAGKMATGTVTLAARSSGAAVVLELHDDGAGLDLDAVRERAIERELLAPEQARAASEAELAQLIFASGLSTSAELGEISGRGLGMAVVRDNVRRLGGDIHVSSTPGHGTSFRLEVPLTRLTTSCLQLRLGAHQLMIPLTCVRATALVECDTIEVVDGGEVVELDGRPLPLLRLERAFDFVADERPRRPVLIVHAGAGARALMVDEVIGQTEVVIQGLGWNLEHVRGVGGAAVLDGEVVVLVLDVDDLLTLDPRRLPRGASQAAAATTSTRRILVVDDSITSRTLLKNILSAAGCEVEVSVDAHAALEQLQGASFDLVVTDIEMPGLDGFELTERIRAAPATRDLPVIICTSLGNSAEKAHGAAVGADAYVVKGSFEQDELLAAIERLC